MDNNEKFRGQTNGIILFILLNGDRHTDELKEIIDEKFSQVKIGTLYSIIARMKTQGHIAEYRASSSDGSRRKYYKITDLGKSVYDNEFAHLFLDVEPIVDKVEELPASEPFVEPEPEYVEEDDVYLKYVKKAELLSEDEGDIDFSTLQSDSTTKEVNEPPKIEEDIPAPEFDDYTLDEEVKEKEVDYDSVVSSNYEYKSVLNQLFPKSKVSFDDYTDYSYTPYSEPVQETAVSVTTQKEDVATTLFEISEKENIKIRTSVDTNRYQGAKILSNKLRFHSSIIITALAVIEFLLLTFMLSARVEFNSKALLTIGIIFGALVVTTGVIYLIKHSQSVKDLPKFINSLEIAIVLTISIIIVSICIASIGGIDIYNFNDVYYSIIVPSVMACNIPLYVATVHFLSKLDLYQAI